jgi:hypothetical protein
MKPVGIVGMILAIVGVIALIYGGITYMSHRKSVNVGPVHASASTHKTIPLPPVFGGVLLAGGIVLVAAGARKT